MKRFITVLLIIVSILTAMAQEKPGNNLGKSLSMMKSKFPELRYIKNNDGDDLYQDGYTQEGISLFFYLRNGFVIEECLIIDGELEDEYPRMFYNKLWESFASKYPYAIKKNTYNDKLFDFGDFKVNLFFITENQRNTAYILYER